MVGVGGVVGAVARLGLDQLFAFTPWATLTVNVIGCLAIGWAMAHIARRPEWWQPLLVTGILGGFTTFSAFAADAVIVLIDRQPMLALGYVAATLIAGLLAVALGERIAR